ncbi:MAG: YdeI/OmpD-associated family protein [Candidatus Yanofskybacteria bacterium]|nr:YdeI/OmpD-associated family protein [Candidatus Yanofskybacteria bacterium]
MTKKGTSTAGVHKVPADLRNVLISSGVARVAWKDITPLARNEWICWIVSAKKPETRSYRIERTHRELIDGKRRPCCWAGCAHR